jgi:hypothetical protein
MESKADEIRCKMDTPWHLMTGAEKLDLDSRPCNEFSQKIPSMILASLAEEKRE